jgi:hypothetical protein
MSICLYLMQLEVEIKISEIATDYVGTRFFFELKNPIIKFHLLYIMTFFSSLFQKSYTERRRHQNSGPTNLKI